LETIQPRPAVKCHVPENFEMKEAIKTDKGAEE
jgi:hypothetical protein